ncbi:MAG: hypothetical protein MMC33_000484 [Icmadophila ericetorum]|nr:hypothetical protein [Icmadophila ericetorum]
MKSSPPLLLLRPSSAFQLISRPPISSRKLPHTISCRIHAHRNTLRQNSRTPVAPQARNFITNPLLAPAPQTLQASRTLPYPASDLYALIADIPSYPAFLPYCTSSRVTSYTAPDANGKRWPCEGELRVGWGGFDESFTSKVYCVPGKIVEAIAGEARTSIPPEQLKELYGQDSRQSAKGNQLFKALLTRWTLRPFHFKPLPPSGQSPQEGSASLPPRARTEVDLTIEVQFANPVYAALGQAAAPKVAGILVEAFEKRAKEVLGQGEIGQGEQMDDKSSLEGDIMQRETQ